MGWVLFFVDLFINLLVYLLICWIIYLLLLSWQENDMNKMWIVVHYFVSQEGVGDKEKI